MEKKTERKRRRERKNERDRKRKMSRLQFGPLYNIHNTKLLYLASIISGVYIFTASARRQTTTVVRNEIKSA